MNRREARLPQTNQARVLPLWEARLAAIFSLIDAHKRDISTGSVVKKAGLANAKPDFN